MVCAGISVGGHTDLHVFQAGTVTGERWDEILDPYVCPYAGVIGNDFMLKDENARPYRAVVVEERLEGLGLELMEWPARSPDPNPIDVLKCRQKWKQKMLLAQLHLIYFLSLAPQNMVLSFFQNMLQE